MFGTDSPCTRTSPSSGYSRPTMCLMQTDFPVPDGPRIIEILSSGISRFSPRRILLRPNALCPSTNSAAASPPVERCSPVCQRYSSSWAGSGGASCGRGAGPPSRWMSGGLRSSAMSGSASDGVWWVRAPEDLGAEHADEVHEHDVEDHRLRGRGAHAHGPARGVVAVVAPHQHDDGGHRHRLDHAV